MNESKLEIFLAKMKVAASNGSSKPEDMTDDGRNPMMQRWLYGFTELVREQDKKILRLCKYPRMIPDELLVPYGAALLGVLEREQKRHMFIVSSNGAIQQVNDIAKRLNICGKYVTAAYILDEIAYEDELEETRYYGINPDLNDER